MSFTNKVVLITGGSSGIGAATAILFAQQGANVVVVGRNEAKLKDVSEKIKKVGKPPLIITADVGNDDDAKRIIDTTIQNFSKINVLVNSAGFARYGKILDGKVLNNYDEMFRVNVRGVIHLTMLAAPYLVKTKGCIVNISSVTAVVVHKPHSIVYGCSKAALNYFSNATAGELAASGVRVNCISAGPVRTDFIKNSGAEKKATWDMAKDQTALKRVSEPDEIGKMILYLCGDDAAGITGAIFNIDNGWLLKTHTTK